MSVQLNVIRHEYKHIYIYNPNSFKIQTENSLLNNKVSFRKHDNQ